MATSPPPTPLHLPPDNDDDDEEPGSSSSRAGSPEGNCPICLEPVSNKAFTDACFHTFCFLCLKEWSQIKATCPMCKASFRSIIHNVVSNDVYDRYHLKPADSGGEFGGVGGSAGRRFRYATTMTEERRVRLRQTRERWRQQQEEMAEQGHLRAASEERRRLIYQDGLWVRRTDSGRYRDISPGFFRRNPATTHRLVPWLRGELSLLFSSQEYVGNLTRYILSLVPRLHMQTQEFLDSLRPFLYGQTEHFVHEFVSFARSPFDVNNYDQIAQYDLTGPSRLTQQQPLSFYSALPSTSAAATAAGSSDVITLSSDDEVVEVPMLRSLLDSDSPSASPPPQPRSRSQFEALDLSSTHNPEPPRLDGEPQASTSGASSGRPPPTIKETVISSDGSDSSEVEIVSFVKPFDERTPECVIILSSSTEEDEAGTQPGGPTDREGGKRQEKRKHTLQDQHHHHRRHQSHKRKHKHHKHKSRHRKSHHHRHHSSSKPEKDNRAPDSPRSRSRSRGRSATSCSSSHPDSKGKHSFGSAATGERSRRESVGSIHLKRMHSSSSSSCGGGSSSTRRKDFQELLPRAGSRSGRTPEPGESWKLLWPTEERTARESGPSEPATNSRSRSRDETTSSPGSSVTASTSWNRRRETASARKRSHRSTSTCSSSSCQDAGDRFRIRQADDGQSSGLTMVISRRKSRSRDGHPGPASGSADSLLRPDSGHHRRKRKKHKGQGHGEANHRPAISLPYTYYNIVYGQEDEANDGDQSSDSTEEEEWDTFS